MKPSKEEVLKSIRRSVLLAKAFNAEAIWLRDHLKPEHKKLLNDTKAKVNHYTSTVQATMSKEAKDIVEEKGYVLLEKILEEI